MLSSLLLAAIEAALCFSGAWFTAHRWCRWCNQIRRVQIVFAGNADQREEGITTGIGQGRTHPMWRRGLADRTDRPVRGNPFSRGMRQNRAKANDARGLINRGSLHGRDFMLA